MEVRNILYLADPNSLHDTKWISFFSSKGVSKCYLLPRRLHYKTFKHAASQLDSNTLVLSPISDFSIVRFYRTLYEAYIIRRIILKYKIEVVHVLYAEPNALWCLFRGFFSVPMIISARGTDVLKTIPEAFLKRDILNKIVAFAYKKAFQLADWVTVTSQTQLDSVSRFSGRMDRLTVIRTGVDVGRLHEDTSQHFPLRDSKPFILFPRYLKPLYNHEFSLSAIALLPSNIKMSYKMVFVGKGSGEPLYERLMEELMQVQSDVDFEFIAKQSQEAIVELYKRTRLVVMVPVSDGSPVSGMEALLCGAKLILGPLNYDPDIFSQAIKLKDWNINELAQAITQAVEDSIGKPELTTEMKLLMDRNYNMQRMQDIYKMVCKDA